MLDEGRSKEVPSEVVPFGGREAPGRRDRVEGRDDPRSLFIAGWPFEPEDLRDDTEPCLVSARVPRAQRVADVHTPAGVAAVGLPQSYALDTEREVIGHDACQPIGVAGRAQGLRGVRYLSARVPDGAGREMEWFPATSRSRASLPGTTSFEASFYG